MAGTLASVAGALFIGGLGVFNSVQAHLQGKLGTLATLRALCLRHESVRGGKLPFDGRESGREFADRVGDLGMPNDDGYALIRQVRAWELSAGGHIPAVALTGFASQADRDEALALGFDEHIAKPASPHDVARALATLVKGGE